MARTLLGQGHPLAVLDRQFDVLRPGGRFPSFESLLAGSGLDPLTATGLDVFQMNLGRMCNQTCHHCHVDAGPERSEVMTRETMELCLAALARTTIPRVDLTGGAPEMNPGFRWLVGELRAMGRHVMDRCNLTILTVGGFRDLPEFLAGHGVEVIASLPYFLARNTDAQRGEGVFEASIAALRRLNDLGYGRAGSGLVVNLVYNPTGAFLAPRQASVEPEYRRELERRHGVVFNDLFVLNNMPINRFLEYLVRTGQDAAYLQRLVEAYNPSAAAGVMCRTTLSVGWDGRLHDCDFNQMLDLGLGPGLPGHVAGFDPERLAGRRVVTGQHCLGCTAGQGSSCGGAVVR